MYKLTTRKIIKISETCYIALPRSWLEHENLIEGQLLEFYLDEIGRLVICSGGGQNGRP